MPMFWNKTWCLYESVKIGNMPKMLSWDVLGLMISNLNPWMIFWIQDAILVCYGFWWGCEVLIETCCYGFDYIWCFVILSPKWSIFLQNPSNYLSSSSHTPHMTYLVCLNHPIPQFPHRSQIAHLTCHFSHLNQVKWPKAAKHPKLPKQLLPHLQQDLHVMLDPSKSTIFHQTSKDPLTWPKFHVSCTKLAKTQTSSQTDHIKEQTLSTWPLWAVQMSKTIRGGLFLIDLSQSYQISWFCPLGTSTVKSCQEQASPSNQSFKHNSYAIPNTFECSWANKPPWSQKMPCCSLSTFAFKMPWLENYDLELPKPCTSNNYSNSSHMSFETHPNP